MSILNKPRSHCHEKSRFSEEQFAYALKQADAGNKVQEICRQMGISQATFFINENDKIMGYLKDGRVLDKHSILEKIRSMDYVGIELGCGSNKRKTDYIGIDIIDSSCVDIVGDIYDVISLFPDKSVDFVYSNQFFEHVGDIKLLISEMARIMKIGAISEVIVPHFANPYYYSDYTHKSFFGLYTMSYLAIDDIFRRKVPDYGVAKILKLVNVRLRFRSPFYLTYPHRIILEILINVNSWIQEMYEQNFCYIIPCNDVRYILERI
jgi:hypothetical protein